MHSSPLKVLYNPQAFFTHAALLDQACAHCPIFPTAASRRSLGRVSVPVWLVVLSDQLRIEALVSLYLTNKLIRRRLIYWRKVDEDPLLYSLEHMRYYLKFPQVIPHQKADSYALLTRPPLVSTPKSLLPFDLHVLSMPPAFNLSQDQTLQYFGRPEGLNSNVL